VTDLTVRRARLDDAEGFVRAYEASWDATLAPIVGRPLQEFAPFEERIEQFRRGLEQPHADASIWVAERDGEIAGVAVGLGAELRALYVVPEAWGGGAANALMEAVLGAIGSGGAQEATLWVVEDNPRARRFYEREGWEPTGETRVTPAGPAELQYRLQLPA
jgi:GNAT superfamily N-acetyltransferase